MDTKALLAVLVVCCAASCKSGAPKSSEHIFTDGARAFPGFEASKVHDSIFHAHASLVDSDARFGVDLVKKAGVVAVELKVELMGGRDGDEASIVLDAGLMDARLYLEGGQVLERVLMSEVRASVPDKRRRAIADSEVESRPIRGRADPIQGVLFFRIPPRASVVGDRIFVRDASGGMHALDLKRSLLSFRYVSHEGGLQVMEIVYVGLKK